MAKVHILLAAWIVLDLVFATAAQGHGQIDALISFLRKRSSHGFTTTEWSSQDLELPKDSTYLTESNDELAVQQQQQADLIINGLPGQPAGIKFSQYSGFVTVNASTGRALFYYFTEATEDPESKPVLLWLNGGPGCSSVGYGAMEELGPFRPNADGTLSYNPYGWNQVANVLFLDSPAGVGFSYSNTSSDYLESGDKRTAEDSYAFLVNWFERFPQYKSREFYIAGESYAGNYIPELADTILNRKRLSQASFINFEGVMIGNGLMNAETDHTGIYIYAWSHSLISDQTYTGLMRYCTNLTFISPNRSQYCEELNNKFYNEIGRVDLYGIYAPLCVNGSSTLPTQGKSLGAPVYDPCMDDHVMSYMNRSDVQNAFHVTVPEPWSFCNNYVGNVWTDSAASVLPIYAKLISAGIRILVFSGDTDSVVPVTSTRLGIKALNLTIQTPWYTWANKTTDAEVYGYTEIYKGLTFATVRRAGHTVPSYEPEIALDLVTNFLAGKPLTKQ